MFTVDRLPLSALLQAGADDGRTFTSAVGVLLSVIVHTVSGEPADDHLGFPPFDERGVHLTDLNRLVRDDADDFEGDDVRVTDQIRELHGLTFRCLTS